MRIIQISTMLLRNTLDHKITTEIIILTASEIRIITAQTIILTQIMKLAIKHQRNRILTIMQVTKKMKI